MSKENHLEHSEWKEFLDPSMKWASEVSLGRTDQRFWKCVSSAEGEIAHEPKNLDSLSMNGEKSVAILPSKTNIQFMWNISILDSS